MPVYILTSRPRSILNGNTPLLSKVNIIPFEIQKSIRKISSHTNKTHCSMAILNCLKQTGSRFCEQNFSDVNAFYRERMPLEFWKSVQQLSTYRETPVFGGHFEFSQANG